MSNLPSREDLIPSLNNNVVVLPTSVDMEDLKKMALCASQVAIQQLVNSLLSSPSDAVKNRAAELILQIAFGKDKESLRDQGKTTNVVQEIAELIQKAKEA